MNVLDPALDPFPPLFLFGFLIVFLSVSHPVIQLK